MRRTLSAVIPCANSEMLERTIAALKAQTYPVKEIFVIFDGIAPRDIDGCIQIVNTHRLGKAASLNIGIARADSELILCLDSDTLLNKDCLEHLEKHIADDAVVAVARLTSLNDNWISKVREKEYLKWFEDGRGFVNGASFLGDASFLKSHRQKTNTLAEDIAYLFVIGKSDKTWVYCPSAIVRTKEPDSVAKLFWQCVRWSYGGLESQNELRITKKAYAAYMTFFVFGFSALMLLQSNYWAALAILGTYSLAGATAGLGLSLSMEGLLYGLITTWASVFGTLAYSLGIKPKWKPSQ